MSQFLLLYIAISVSVFAAEKRKPSSIDITSTNEVAFYAKKNFEYSQIGKIKQYQGVLIQLNESSSDLNAADLYQFPTEDKIKMDSGLCNSYLEKIFGNEADRSLKLTSAVTLFDSPVGKACDFQLTDNYSRARLGYRYTIIGFVHGRMMGLVWNLYEVPKEETKKKLQNFWKTLK